MNQMWRKISEMDHEEWLQWRREGIGSSTAPSIMQAEGAFHTPYEAWLSIVEGSQQKDNYAMARGREKEPIARDAFNRMMGIETGPVNAENITTPWLRASLDGMDDAGKVLVEIKAPCKEDHFLATMQKVPAKYFIQCQHQLMVTGLDGMYYFSFDGQEGVIVEVARDENFIKNELFPKEKEFWESVVNLTPPPLTEKDYVDLAVNPRWQHLSNRLKEISHFSKEIEDIKEEMKLLAEGRNVKGGGIYLTKEIVKGTIDYKRAFDEYKIPLETYRKNSYVKWRFKGI